MRTALFTIALLLTAACTDQQRKAAAPTEPASPPSAAVAVATPPVRGLSTVCMSFMTQRSNVADKLVKTPRDLVLLRKHASLDTLVERSCR